MNYIKPTNIQTGLPFSLEAERAVIGTILATPSVVHTIELNLNYFFQPDHRLIITAMQEIIKENKPPEPVLIYNKLKEQDNHLKVGDFKGLIFFLEFNSRPEFIEYWLAEVKKYWKLRTIVEVCGEVSQNGKDLGDSYIETFLSYAESKFFEISESMVQKELTPVSEIVKKVISDFENLFKNDGKTSGVPSGFDGLDKIFGGFQPSDLIILAARPAMGKTSLALNFAQHAAINLKKTVAFFSLEMSSTQIMQRMISTTAKVESQKFRTGQMTQEELKRIYPCAASLYEDNSLYIDDTASISILDLASRCRRLKREKGKLDMIFIDYLQLMSAANVHNKNMQNREREISVISMGLKALAKELNCPVIALSQLNRLLEQRTDKRPRPSDLRESGSIEQDADQIMFVYRDEVYNKDSPEKGVAEIIIGKNRHGAIDTVKLAFDNIYTKFYNMPDTYT
jgi:replicative DNA helicase